MSTVMQTDWWRGAVIYQIYPRSFKDSNGDGIGDLAGIIEKLDYLQTLGIEAIWISPFCTSPMQDFGYDVANYCDVDPMFGTLADFDRLVAAAHARNIKIIMDQVWGHSSDAHPWFQESRSHRDAAKADWYIWADARPDGTPPNNWLSYFGGSAWQWDTRRCQYYLHHFLTSQPALNLRQPALLAEIEAIARFWFARGVDGFRLDAIQAYLCHPDLLDNPPRLAGQDMPADLPPTNPLAYQRRINSGSRPEIIDLAKWLRGIANDYPERVLLAEVGGEHALTDAVALVQTGERLHLAYTFSLFFEQLQASKIVAATTAAENILGDGWLCWASSNHDVERVATRWAQPTWQAAGVSVAMLAKLMLAVGLSLRGSFCLYQGEELGLTEADVPHEKMRDPYGITFYPEFKGRDGCRTPMPWNAAAPHGGFSTAEVPWLPVPPEHLAASVAAQEQSADSMLHFTRRFLAWRKASPALRSGTISYQPRHDAVLSFVRSTPEQELFCAFNISAEAVTLTLPADYLACALQDFPHQLAGRQLTLPACSAFFGERC
jgi:alpha-glucosidase